MGRPNVGKSALFNRIVGKRIAIVHDEPGVTRDRITAEAEWQGRPFTLVDTGGIGLLRGEKAQGVIVEAARAQVQIAIDSAHLIILVTDGREGLMPLDREVADLLRHSGKPVLVAVNKIDTEGKHFAAAEFAELGFEQCFAVSAIHDHGISALLDTALAIVPASAAPPEPAADAESASSALSTVPEPGTELVSPREPIGPLKLAIVGRPNVGKSSLVNALTQSQRVIVSAIPGTTRDSVDVPFSVQTDGRSEHYILIDTAGLRKRRSVDTSVEFFSVKRAEDSVHRCDIVILVLDAEAGILEQDKKIADLITTENKACLIVINKWDLMTEDLAKARQAREAKPKPARRYGKQPERLTTLAEFGRWVQDRLFFLDYAPVLFTSAKDGLNLDRLIEALRYVSAQLLQKIPTALLNRTLHQTIEQRQPVSHQGHRLKFFYATQVKLAPPTFLLFVNRQDLFSPAYNKYLCNELRKSFGYEGCPIVLVPKARPKTIEPKRKYKKT